MKKFLSLAVIGLVILTSCTKGFDVVEPEPTPVDPTPTTTSNKATQEEINANVVKVFGTTFSANQDWSSTNKYTVSITADAPMNDVAKVQILTESPYFNEDARVLNEATTNKGQTVSLTFDCPVEYKELIAACVDSKGVYYITHFNVGESSVKFQKAASSRTRAEYSLPDLPEVSNLKMQYKNSYLSFNAIRAQKAGQEGESNVIAPWKDSNWDNERIWMLDNAGGNSTWTVNKSAIYRSASITNEEVSGLETVFEALGGKKAKDGKKINLKTIRESPVYVLTKNYLVSDGKAPITVTPVMMFSSEIGNTSLYYYYFDPADLEGKTEEEQVTFLKNLPKFKCVDSKTTKQACGVKDNEFFKVHEYLIPYFGKVSSNETNDVTAQGFIFPEGTRIGFMLRKTKEDWTDSFTEDNTIQKGTNYSNKSYEKTNNGEIYADGRLNEQINQYPDFKSAVSFGMELTDPRAAIFGANQKAYLLFEDGTDINYVDLVVEIQGGLVEVDAAQQINTNVYTFCFEDRNLGDYDMNDVVIKAERLNMSQVKYTVVACGAYDELYLRNINGQTLNGNTEIHSLFGVTNLQTFINTQSKNYEPVSEVVTVDPSFSFTDFSKQVYIYNKTQDYDVKMAQKGEDPHAIMIPTDFAYPKEKVCVKDAYKQFNNWGTNPVSSTDWFEYPEEDKVMNAYTK